MRLMTALDPKRAVNVRNRVSQEGDDSILAKKCGGDEPPAAEWTALIMTSSLH